MIYDYDIQPALIRPQRLSNMYPFPTRQGFEEFFLQNHGITDPAGRVSVFFSLIFVGLQNLKGMHGGEWSPKKSKVHFLDLFWISFPLCGRMVVIRHNEWYISSK